MASFTVAESSSSSPCSSSSTPRLCTYHVFLSFRGEDTRKGFTDHLCASLETKGITTFRDDKDLERGQVISKELLKAIEESMFAITILSPDYASSAWCLDELQKILECNNNLDLDVLPVFYGVDPFQPYEAQWSTEAFSKTSQLKFLSLYEMQLPLGLSCLPCSLKVLHWRGCPLKTLKLTFSKKLKRLPDFSGVPNLEKLILKGCASLTEVHPSLVHHKKVVLMNLEDCKSLKSLPGKLEMSSLKKLILSGCSEFKFLPEFGESMGNLSVLSLEGTALRKLPSSLGCLIGLAILNLKDCNRLVCLPDTIHGLNSLRILNICGCSKLCRLPDVFKEIKCLEELHANDTAVDELPSSIFYLDSLKVLSFAGCKGPLTKKSMNWFLPFNWMSGSQSAPTGLRFPSSVWSLPSLRDINLSYCNLSEESVLDNFFHLSSLEYLDLTGNNFVSIPSNISKLSALKELTLNRCQNLQLLPELLPSSIIKLDASNCDSLETSRFNPAKPCSLFASSPIRLLLPQEFKAFWRYLGLYISRARFEMLIPGNEISSWFVPQRCVSRAKIQVPNNCPLDECVGFALCFQLVSYVVPPESCEHEIHCWLFARNDITRLICTRRLPPMDPSYPHLYILYLSIDQIRDKIPEDDDYWSDWSETEIKLESNCCRSLRIVRCGCRLVCKQDVEDWNKGMSQFNKS